MHVHLSLLQNTIKPKLEKSTHLQKNTIKIIREG